MLEKSPKIGPPEHCNSRVRPTSWTPTGRSPLPKVKTLPPFDLPCLRLQTQIKSHRSKHQLSSKNGNKVPAEISFARTFHRHRHPPTPPLTFGPLPSPSPIKDLTIWVIFASLNHWEHRRKSIEAGVAPRIQVRPTHLLLITSTCSIRICNQLHCPVVDRDHGHTQTCNHIRIPIRDMDFELAQSTPLASQSAQKSREAFTRHLV